MERYSRHGCGQLIKPQTNECAYWIRSRNDARTNDRVVRVCCILDNHNLYVHDRLQQHVSVLKTLKGETASHHEIRISVGSRTRASRGSALSKCRRNWPNKPKI